MSERVFHTQVRARYAETDAQGVIHHSAYVAWLELARIEALREVGKSYRALEADGMMMPVVGLEVRYRRSTVFDDLVDIATTVQPEGRTRLAFASELSVAGQLVATATVTIALLGTDGRPQRMPPELVALLQ